ncbi:hypothetical protein WMF27_19925 [Sorangium sp. So ce281]|uniref:hypothetical protein n=1 Tax=Sorangium sp. So ce281 TaxID=3133293 RepID=UPI003F61E493
MTSRLVQQLSLPSGPHVESPGPPGAQLGGSSTLALPPDPPLPPLPAEAEAEALP